MGSFEQSEPLTTRLGNIIKDYNASQTVQELLQNCDDARAPHVTFLLDKRPAGSSGASLKPLLEASADQLRANESTQSLVMQRGSDVQWLAQQFAGPALYQYDSAVFEEKDFESLSNLGDGNKKCDPTKIGKFCLGFNCVYHLTDLPCFVSDHSCVFLDPHKRLFSKRDGDLQSATGGWRFDMRDRSLAEAFAPVFAPFTCSFEPKPHEEYTPWDVSGTRWNGTMFRFPLRSTQETTDRSLIVAKSQGAARMMSPDIIEKEVLEPFMDNAVERLLFMRYVESVSIYVWEPGALKPEQTFHMCIKDMDAECHHLRRLSVDFVRNEMKRFNEEVDHESRRTGTKFRRNESVLRFMRSLLGRISEIPRVVLPMCFQIRRRGRPVTVDHWALATMVGGEDEINFAIAEEYDGEEGPARNDQCMWPYAAVAAHLATGTLRDDGMYRPGNHGRMPTLDGRAFCTLPTPIRTGLPVHVDGRWELKVDRNNLVLDLTCVGTDKQRTHWNFLLLERVVAGAYARLLKCLAVTASESSSLRAWLKKDGVILKVQDFYRLFPQSAKSEEGFFARVAKPTFNMLGLPCGDLLPVSVAGKSIISVEDPAKQNNFNFVWRFSFAGRDDAKAGVRFLRVLPAKGRSHDSVDSEDAMSIFARFDKDGSGFLSKTELRQALSEIMDESVVEDLDFDKLWDATAKRLDGEIDENEFLKMMDVSEQPESEQPSISKQRSTSGGLPTSSGRLVQNISHLCTRHMPRPGSVDGEAEFAGLDGLFFRLVGIDKVTASCFGVVDGMLADPVSGSCPVSPEEKALKDLGISSCDLARPASADVAQVPRQWAKARNIINRLFGSSFSVEHCLLMQGARITDAPPEIYEELRSTGALRLRPTNVRQWFNVDSGLISWPERESTSFGHRVPAHLLPRPLGDERAVLSLLMYCLSDQSSNENSLQEMRGCALLPLRDGSVGVVPPGDVKRPLLLDTDAFPDTSPSIQPFGMKLCNAPQLFLTKPAGAVLSALKVAKELGCAQFSPKELAKLFGEHVLPAEWKGHACIGRSFITDDEFDKLSHFWAFIDWYAARVEPAQVMEHFGEWPLIPTFDGRLVQLKLAEFVLRATCDGQPVEVEALHPKDRELADVLSLLSVPLVVPSTSTQAMPEVLRVESAGVLPSLESAAPSAKALLHWAANGHDFPDLSPLERQVVLRLLSLTTLDDTQLQMVRNLPIFELQDFPGQFTKMREGVSHYTMADFSIEGFEVKSRDKSSICFLKEPRAAWAPLYEQLHVQSLPREIFHTTYCFESFAHLPEKVKLGILNDLRANFEQIRNRDVGGEPFSAVLKRAPLFWHQDTGAPLTVCDLLNPEDDLVKLGLLPELAGRLPPSQLRSADDFEDWLRVLHSWGMPEQLPMRTLLEIASLVSEQMDPDAAAVMLKYFTERFGALHKQEDEADWNQQVHKFSTIPLGCNEQMSKKHCVAPKLPLPTPSDKALVPLRGARLLNKFESKTALVWSQQTLVHWPGPLPPDDTLEALGMFIGPPELDSVLQQYLVVKDAVEQNLRPQISSHLRPLGCQDLEDLYDFLNSQLRAAPDCETKLAAVGLSASEPCILTEASDGVWRFMKPDVVFTGTLPKLPGVDMHRLSYSAPLRDSFDLRRYLGVRYEPTVDEIQAALMKLGQQLRQHAGSGEQPSVAQLRFSMVRIAELLVMSLSRPHPDVLVVDHCYRVSPVAKTLMNDTPWLQGRINLESLPLLHSDLERNGQWLGVQYLSDVVEEQLVSAERVAVGSLPPALQTQLGEWQRLCSCPEFRSGLWRLQLAAKLAPDLRRECKARLYGLEQLDISAVSSILSRFMVWGEDVTLQQEGSPSFLGSAGGRLSIYLLMPKEGQALRTWQRQLPLQIDRHFHCGNPYAVSEMLRVSQPEDIGVLLDEMRVPMGVLNEAERLVGLILEDASLLVPESNSASFDLTEFLGKAVVVSLQERSDADPDQSFCYALLNQVHDSGMVLVDGGSMLGARPVARSRVWAVRSRREKEREEEDKAQEKSTGDHGRDQQRAAEVPTPSAVAPATSPPTEDSTTSAEASSWKLIVKADKKGIFSAESLTTKIADVKDVSSGNYMIVGKLTPTDYVHIGEYTFKLVYRSNSRKVEMQWAQTSWLTDKDPTGFRPISISDSSGKVEFAHFTGLRDCTKGDFPGAAAFCSTHGWWAAVGHATLHAGGIPAWPPDGGAGGSVFIADSAELFIREQGDKADKQPGAGTYEHKMSDEWVAEEKKLRENIRQRRQDKTKELVKEPKATRRQVAFKDVGDDLKVQFSEENPELKALYLEEAQVGVRTSAGYDLVLVGNMDMDGRVPAEIAFYHHRTTMHELTEQRTALVRQCCRILREVAENVFNYPAYNVGLFYQRESASRFIRQQILVNIWPIEVHCQDNKLALDDLVSEPFPYLYVYGLLVHKLAHFFDAVHGTRHDFYMNELRIEYLSAWLEFLESKGWDPAALEHKTFKSGMFQVKLIEEVVL